MSRRKSPPCWRQQSGSVSGSGSKGLSWGMVGIDTDIDTDTDPDTDPERSTPVFQLMSSPKNRLTIQA